MRIVILWACLAAFISSAYGQHIHEYQATVSTLISSSQTPFWLRANQYGIVPLQSPIGSFNINLQSGYKARDSSNRRKVDWGYGINAIANLGTVNQLLLPEAYIKGRIGALEFSAGRRRDIVGLVDTLLTSGAYIWSGNSLPLPKIQIGFPQFTTVPFTKGIVSFMGVYAHGWFESSDRLVKGSYLHQKYLYGRIGKQTWPFRIYAGFNHQVMWAGYYPDLSPNFAVDGKLPSSIKYYPAVVFGTRGTLGTDLTSFDINRIGNHLGSVDLAIDLSLKDWNLYLYRQFLYDDGSLFYGSNLEDGLNGIRLKNNKKDKRSFSLKQVTFEYLFTGSQGGDEFILGDSQRRGQDDYFNNSQFVDGWTYYRRTIGTPFLTPVSEVVPALQSRAGIVNNRVSAFHLGVIASLFKRVDLQAKLSYSYNAGTYAITYYNIPTQFSGLLTAGIPTSLFGGTQLTASLAVDAGKLLPNSVGGYIGLRKTGLLNSRSAQRIVSPR